MMTELRAEAAVYGGYALARHEGVVFIRGAIPGEVVEAEVIEKKRDYSVASVTSVLEPSPDRVEPPCPVFGECGGCQLQFAAYGRQVAMKAEVLTDCLARIGGLEPGLQESLSGGPFAYRMRGQFKVDPRRGAIGFYREVSRDVVSISACPLMVREVNESFARVRETDLSGIREVHITAGGDGEIALIRGIGYDDGVAARFEALGFAGVAFADGSFRTRGYVTLDLNGLIYTVSPWSFFQSNWRLNTRVAGLIAEGLGPLEGRRVLDLYAGGGNFSLPLCRTAQEVVAVEGNPDSIKDGARNLLLNDIKNMVFVEGRAETAKIRGSFDVALLNPPRPGLSGAAMERMLELAPERIAYLSCNPSTLARDLRKFGVRYEVESVRMIDFFPNTFHVEALAFLRRKEIVGEIES